MKKNQGKMIYNKRLLRFIQLFNKGAFDTFSDLRVNSEWRFCIFTDPLPKAHCVINISN
jgi:hypothetical protein